MRRHVKAAAQKLALYAEELILLFIIILNILDFFELLSPDWDYIKKVISWTVLGYLLYKVQITKILFGHENRRADIALVIAYFALSFKIILGYSVSMLQEIGNRGFSFWARIVPLGDSISLGQANVISLQTSINNTPVSSLHNLQIDSPVDWFSDLPTIIFSKENWFFPKANTVILEISNNVSSSYFALETKFFIHRWLNLLVSNAEFLYRASLIIGMIMLISISLWLTLRLSIRKPSMMHVIHEEGPPPARLAKIMERLFFILLVVLFFYIALVNLVLEWLAFSIDAPILMIGLLFYILFWIKHYKKFHMQNLIFRVGEFGENLYVQLLTLFHTKKGILLSIAGMLALHLLTDLGTFILPYLTGIYDPLYFSHLGSGHSPLLSISGESIIISDLANSTGILDMVSMIYMYAGNIAAIILLLLLPSIVWYYRFMKKHIIVKRKWLFLYFSSISCLIFAPAFHIGRLTFSSPDLQGVDIRTSSILESASADIIYLAAVSLFLGYAAYSLSSQDKLRKIISKTAVIVSSLFFLLYTYYYFSDMFLYYSKIIPYLLLERTATDIAIGCIMLIFFSLTIIFYAIGAVIVTENTYLFRIENPNKKNFSSTRQAEMAGTLPAKKPSPAGKAKSILPEKKQA